MSRCFGTGNTPILTGFSLLVPMSLKIIPIHFMSFFSAVISIPFISVLF
jgi:hypothetical protein